jgi:hypothetical protein
MDDFDDFDEWDLNNYGELGRLILKWREIDAQHNRRRRFMRKFNSLSDGEQHIIGNVLNGNDVLSVPEQEQYLSSHIRSLERFDTLLSEIYDTVLTTDNSALHKLLLFMAKFDKQMANGFNHWDLIRNQHADADIIKGFVQFDKDLMHLDPTLVEDTVRHPNTSADLLHELTDIEATWHLRKIARHPNCARHTLIKLLQHKLWKVREGVAVAPNATDDILLKLLEDQDERVRTALRRVKTPSKLVLEGMFWANMEMNKRHVTQLVKKAPEYAWASTNDYNSKHKDYLISMRKDMSAPKSEQEIMSAFLNRKEDALRNINAECLDISSYAVSESERLDKEYSQHPEKWKEIIRNPHCSKPLISKIFIEYGDVDENPMVLSKMAADPGWPRTLMPGRRQERLKLAETSPYEDVLKALFIREEYKPSREKADIELLKRLALNVNTSPELLEWIYEVFAVKEVLLNPNCTSKLRRLALEDK